MVARLPFRGTILNTALVLAGSGIGLGLGSLLSRDLKPLALSAIGLVTLAFGVKLFLETRNVLVPTIAMVLGVLLGAALHIDLGLEGMAEWARGTMGGGGTFSEGLIAASVLFCVGPMTLLGCVKDGLERNIELLSMKSVLDFVASVFLAATLGFGVMVSAAVVLVVQGGLTALARPLKPLVDRPQLVAEASSTGGAILIAIGLSLLEIKSIKTELFLPALFIAPLIAPLFARAKGDLG